MKSLRSWCHWGWSAGYFSQGCKPSGLSENSIKVRPLDSFALLARHHYQHRVSLQGGSRFFCTGLLRLLSGSSRLSVLSGSHSHYHIHGLQFPPWQSELQVLVSFPPPVFLRAVIMDFVVRLNFLVLPWFNYSTWLLSDNSLEITFCPQMAIKWCGDINTEGSRLSHYREQKLTTECNHSQGVTFASCLGLRDSKTAQSGWVNGRTSNYT